jgi:hypothetical protein
MRRCSAALITAHARNSHCQLDSSPDMLALGHRRPHTDQLYACMISQVTRQTRQLAHSRHH